ncbi:Cilia- and flagella-associated protein 47 [Thoreauomyces humboldtii]|nr:Cilia- and flagella-associated protein 47 [Thoreauomyces humboldtii]
MASKLDLVAPAAGTRVTPFTGLLAVSSKSSLAADQRDDNLERTFYSLRVAPERITINDYEPGSLHKRAIRVRNLTRRIKRVAFQYPTNERFKLHSGPIHGWHSLAPGLDVEIEIEFSGPTAPAVSEESPRSAREARDTEDPSLLQYTDSITIVVEGEQDLIVPLEAFPVGPSLEVQPEIDFGTIALGRVDDENERAPASGAWHTAHLKVRNVGKRRAKVVCSCDPELPIRISTARFALSALPDLGSAPSNRSRTVSSGRLVESVEAMLKVEFRPETVGDFAEYISIQLENDVPRASTKRAQNTTVLVKGTLIDHKLALHDVRTNRPLDYSRIDFGAVYYSQEAVLRTKLVNKGSTPQKWVITHAGENKPMVPGFKIRESLGLAGDVSENTLGDMDTALYAITLRPSEGVIQPFSSVDVNLTFSPRAPVVTSGFKATLQPPDLRKFAVPMELKIVNSSSQTAVGEEPIRLQLKGVACPVLTSISSRLLEFRPLLIGDELGEDLVIRNRSNVLSCRYALSSVAQFHADPSTGVLGPLEERTVRVAFRPNQLGNFRTTMECTIKPGQQSPESSVRFVGSQVIERIQIKLTGACVAASSDVGFPRYAHHHHHIARFDSHSDTSENPTDGAEWASATARGTVSRYASEIISPEEIRQAKSHSNAREEMLHRGEYTAYIRERRGQRIQEIRRRRLGDDGVDVDTQKLDLAEACLEVDRDNGLLAPEPLDFLEYQPGTRKTAEILVSAEAQKVQARGPQVDNTDARKLRVLFEQLMEPVVFRDKLNASPEIPTTAGASGYDQSLSGHDLANIFAAHTFIDFGKVTVHSVNSCPLNILNAISSNQPVHVRIQIADDSHSTDGKAAQITVCPSHQVLAPMSLAGFEVKFSSTEPGTYTRKVTYTVNGRYKYSLPVRVEVLPVHLEVSTKAVFLEVDPTSGLQEGTEVPVAETEVILKNTGNFEAGFLWEVSCGEKTGDSRSEGRFSVQPKMGTVAAKSQTKVKISYVPGIKPVDEAELVLQVLDQKERVIVEKFSVHCKGSTPASHCVLLSSNKQGAVDLGILSVGFSMDVGSQALLNALYSTVFRTTARTGSDASRGTAFIRVKNTASNPALFTAANEHVHSEAQIEPPNGSIPAMSTTELSLQCIPTHCGVVEDAALITTVGGGKVIRVPYRYEARAPEVHFEVQPGDMSRGTVVGSSGYKRIIMSNKGSVVAGVVIDLREHPEFELKIRDVASPTRKQSAPSRPRTTSGRQRRVKEPDTLSKNGHLIQTIVRDHPLFGFDACQRWKNRPPQGRVGRIFLLEIPVSETVVVDIAFVPTSVRFHSFNLTMHLMGVMDIPTVSIEAEGVQSPLHLSRTSIDFKNRVVHRGDGIHAVSHLKTASKEVLVLTNQSKNSMEWWFDLDPLEYADKVFKVEPWRDQLVAGQSQTITITFQPESTGLFETALPLHLDYLGPKSLLSIPLQGFGVEPALAFDPPEIFLPITPVGVESTAIFSIINYGCERTEIRELIPEEIHGSIELSFPEGKLLKSDGEKLTVVARFLRHVDFPLSFTAKLQISSDGRRAFYLPVHGTSDSSLLSLQPYIWLNGESQRPTEAITENQKRNRILHGPRPFKTPSGIPLEHGPELTITLSFLCELGETLTQWLDDHISVPMAWKAFPQQLVSSGGQVLQDLIHSITGRKISVPPAMNHSNAEEAVKAVYAQNAEVLTYLVANGALLSPVKPEFLLSLEEYRLHNQMDTICQKREMGTPLYEEHYEYKQKVEKYWEAISKDTWCTLLLQIVRVFMAQPVTLRMFRNLPGVDKQEAAMDWQVTAKAKGSVGTSENVLLRWVAFHSWKWTSKPHPLTNFTSDFASGAPLAYLLTSHLPALSTAYFRHLKGEDSSDETRQSTQTALQSALNDLFPGCTAMDYSLDKIRDGGKEAGINLYLLLLFLLQTLPAFIPKTQVEFHCKLNETVQREIELTNPSTRPLTYICELQGFGDFTLITTDSATAGSGLPVTIPPKSTIRLPVEFKSRFCRPTQGNLVLRSRKMGLGCASVMVFDLRSVVQDAVPSKVVKIDGVVYATPPTSTEIEVVNPFAVKGRFKVELKESQHADSDNGPASFHALANEIVLDGNQSGTISITFLPFVLGAHHCLIHFIDENVGEFAYQLCGRGLTPHPMESVAWTAKAGEPLEKAFRISGINSAREKALQYAAGGVKARKNKKGSLEILSSTDAVSGARKGLRFKVEYSSNIFRGPSEISIKPPMEQTGKDKKHVGTIEHNHTELPIAFHPRSPGKYTGRILLTCLDTSDLRVLAISAVAISEGSRATLHFAIPARQTVIQDIPIVNRTDEDWTIKGSKQFSGPHSLIVQARGTTNYSITFSPLRAGEAASVLTLSNLQTAQKHVYNLRGTGLDPLPAGKKDITCRAREKTVEKLVVYNASEQDAEYNVSTDVPFAAGAPSIWVGAGQSATYELSIQARRSGQFERSVVTFTNPHDGSYVWYSVTLQVLSPPAEDTIPVSTTVRQPVLLDIPLSNPTSNDITYTAKLSGEGLTGESKVTVSPNEEKLLVVLKMKGTGRIQFYNDEVGEFWYNLSLEAKDGPPVELETMSCSLGKCESQMIPIRNPLDRSVTLNLNLSNALEFQLLYPKAEATKSLRSSVDGRSELQINLSPHESTAAQLIFWPTSLTEAVKAVVSVSSPDIGEFVFHVQGQGTLPTPFPPTVVSSLLQHPTTSSITFVNPLPDSIAITIALEQRDGNASPEFSLVHARQKKMCAEGMQSIIVPFVYRPQRMIGNDARVVVKMEGSTGFTWVYPLTGIPERILTTATTVLEARSRETLVRDLEVLLPGYISGLEGRASGVSPLDEEDSSAIDVQSTPLFIFRLAPVSNDRSTYATDVEQEAVDALTLDLLESQVVDEQGALVRIRATYAPPRPTTQPLHLYITSRASRSTWRTTIRLLSHAPSLDDTIVIEGMLNKLSCVSFTIRSLVPHDRPFRAFFTGRSEEANRGEFAVFPQEGVLTAEQNRTESDNGFVVGYRAREYGKTTVGMLIVECEDISWTFEIRGVTPASTLGHASNSNAAAALRSSPASKGAGVAGGRYAAVSSTAHSVMSTAVPQHGPRRNFIRENAINPIAPMRPRPGASLEI